MRITRSLVLVFWIFLIGTYIPSKPVADFFEESLDAGSQSAVMSHSDEHDHLVIYFLLLFVLSLFRIQSVFERKTDILVHELFSAFGVGCGSDGGEVVLLLV